MDKPASRERREVIMGAKPSLKEMARSVSQGGKLMVEAAKFNLKKGDKMDKPVSQGGRVRQEGAEVNLK